MNAFIVDDEPPATRAIEALLNQYQGDFPINIVGICNDASTAIKQINTLQPNVLFLDIEMPGYTGFELLEQVKYPNLIVVFVTAYEHYAVEAFEAHALHYIVKPISPLAFNKCLLRINDNLKMKEFNNRGIQGLSDQFKEKSIAVKTRDGYEVVACEEVVNIKSEGAYSEFHLKNGKKLVQSKNMKQCMKMLPAKFFLRISRSAIINTDKVVSFSFQDGGSIFVSNGEELLIGKTYRSEIFKFLRERYSV